jgi:hypothetical protein
VQVHVTPAASAGVASGAGAPEVYMTGLLAPGEESRIFLEMSMDKACSFSERGGKRLGDCNGRYSVLAEFTSLETRNRRDYVESLTKPTLMFLSFSARRA